MKSQVKSVIRCLLKNIPGAWQVRLFFSAYKAPLPVILKSHKEMLKYKNKYKGQRCFIIGNGPSLRAKDLDILENEICFAANRIYNVFPQTKWRPAFYCVQDENVLREMEDKDIVETLGTCQAAFVRMHSCHIIKSNYYKFHNLIFVPISLQTSKSGKALFSNKADRLLFDGGTVTYMSLQLAAYMGFENIYLLGVDHNFPYIWTGEGKLRVNDLSVASHFYDGAENNTGHEAWKRRGTNPEITTAAYQAAENYSRRSKKFRICNVTRGGKLEVFERADLNEIV